MSNQQLLRTFDGAVIGANRRREYRGLLGTVIDGAKVVQLPDRPLYVYVRLVAGDPTAPVVARNDSVSPDWGTPVFLTKEDDQFIVKRLDSSTIAAVQGESATSSAGVAPHTHAIGSAMPDYVEALRFTPGLVSAESGLYVRVQPFAWWDNGDWRLYPGDTIDLSGDQPSSGAKCWVKIGFDPATETLVSVAGDVVSGIIPLLESDLESIYFSEIDAIPLGAVQLYGGTSTWTSPSQFTSTRVFFSGPDIKHNLSASAAPTTGDDDADGYRVGSVWIDTSADKSYICVDAQTGAASWHQTNNIPGDIDHDLLLNYDVNQHRALNDLGTTTSELWSASKIQSELDTKADLGFLQVDISDVSNPPTDAELDSIFGTPATAGNGFTAIINDNDADTNVYMVVAVGDVWAIFTAAIAA